MMSVPTPQYTTVPHLPAHHFTAAALGTHRRRLAAAAPPPPPPPPPAPAFRFLARRSSSLSSEYTRCLSALREGDRDDMAM